MQTIGTCGNCGGPVQSPLHWGGPTPPPQRCATCGARPKHQYGPVIPMDPIAGALQDIRERLDQHLKKLDRANLKRGTDDSL